MQILIPVLIVCYGINVIPASIDNVENNFTDYISYIIKCDRFIFLHETVRFITVFRNVKKSLFN